MQAAPYMQVLIDLAVRETNNDLLSSNIASESLPHMQSATAKTLLGHLMWYDLLAAVSTGRGPLLGISHSFLLETDSVQMHEVSGCQGRVAKALCDIFSLQDWMIQEEQNERLSIIELASRANAIHQRLAGIIDQLDVILALGSTKSRQFAHCTNLSCSGRLGQCHRDAENDITLAFAWASKLYLHVVISGPNPQVNEIRKAAVGLAEAFNNLADKKMLGYVPWPLCVMACFAEDDEMQVLDILVSGDGTSTSHRGICTEALSVAKECQRLRKEEGRNCGWAVAMQNLQKYILLA